MYKFKFGLPDYKDLLQYGEVIEDYKFSGGGQCTRVRKIKYMDILYHLQTVNGEVTSLVQWDTLPYNEDELDLLFMGDADLARLLMFSGRDRKVNPNAERVYWLCIEEISRRDQYNS